jgi:hypothetical protein
LGAGLDLTTAFLRFGAGLGFAMTFLGFGPDLATTFFLLTTTGAFLIAGLICLKNLFGFF